MGTQKNNLKNEEERKKLVFKETMSFIAFCLKKHLIQLKRSV